MDMRAAAACWVTCTTELRRTDCFLTDGAGADDFLGSGATEKGHCAPHMAATGTTQEQGTRVVQTIFVFPRRLGGHRNSQPLMSDDRHPKGVPYTKGVIGT